MKSKLSFSVFEKVVGPLFQILRSACDKRCYGLFWRVLGHIFDIFRKLPKCAKYRDIGDIENLLISMRVDYIAMMAGMKVLRKH